MKRTLCLLTLATLLTLAAAPVHAANTPFRVLFFTRSEGFEHSVIAEKDGKPSWAGTILEKLVTEMGGEMTTTKDGSVITADNLKKYDVVVFYTQGDLLKAEGKDNGAPVSATACDNLLAWIKNGGKYFGFHSASDTYHTPEGAPVTPYIEMVGGEFIHHGQQFKGALKVVDPKHPAMANIPDGWSVPEEWYCFKNFNPKTMHVLALLEPGDEGRKQDMYKGPAYPMIWCSTYGNGRVFFNGMGHREDLWMNATFKKSIIDAFNWLRADGPAQADSNFDSAVPKAETK